MSFKRKWLLISLFAQLLIGGVIASIWYVHQTNVSVEQLNVQRHELEQAVRQFELSLSHPGKDDFERLVRQLHVKTDALGTRISRGEKIVASIGQTPTADSGYQPSGKTIERWGDSTLLLNTIPSKSRLQVQLALSNEIVYSERDAVLHFILWYCLISAIASSLIMLSLGNTLAGRLLHLRDKAIALRAGQTGVRVQLQGHDEVAVLGEAFNQMASSIEAHLGDLHSGALELENQRNRLDLILASLNTGVAYLDSRSNVQYINRALANMLKIRQPLKKSARLIDILLSGGVVGGQREALDILIRENLYNYKTPVKIELEDGRVLRLRFQIHNDPEFGAHGVLLVEDVSLHKNVRDLREAVERDTLTRVMNRRGFELTLERRIPRLLEDEKLGMIYVDLDGFKAVNDTLGHKAGDQVLKSAAALLTKAVRTSDTVARLGGDEFAIVINRASEVLMVNMAKRIISSFGEEPLFIRMMQNHNLQVTTSIGIAIFPVHAREPAELIDVADEAMYEAKRAGKNCYRISDREPVTIS